MALQDGDVIRFDYTLWSEGQVLDTSLEDRAKELGVHRADKTYRPLTITVGRRQIIPGLEKELKSLDAGQTATVDIPAAQAYGERDPKKVKDVPMAQFRKQKVQPQVGMQINYEGQRAVVTRVAGGRVRLDMNHDLAGKDLRYEVTVNEVIRDTGDKVDAVLKGLFSGGAQYEIHDGTLRLEVPDQAKFDREWPMAKFRVITELRAAAGDAMAIQLVETYPAMPSDDHDHDGHSHEGHDHEGHSHEGHDHEGHSHEGHDHQEAGPGEEE